MAFALVVQGAAGPRPSRVTAPHKAPEAWVGSRPGTFRLGGQAIPWDSKENDSHFSGKVASNYTYSRADKRGIHTFKCLRSENIVLNKGVYYLIDYFILEMETHAQTRCLTTLLPSFKNGGISNIKQQISLLLRHGLSSLFGDNFIQLQNSQKYFIVLNLNSRASENQTYTKAPRFRPSRCPALFTQNEHINKVKFTFLVEKLSLLRSKAILNQGNGSALGAKEDGARTRRNSYKHGTLYICHLIPCRFKFMI